MFSNSDKIFMREALNLAKKVIGIVSPDPAVGAVLVKNGKILAKGYHDRFTAPHAEVYAIKKAGNAAKGSTLFINLEPCCHYGNNPPCTRTVINAGIKRVVASMADPNPLVNGKGFKQLQKAGIKVDIGLMEEEAKSLNESFVKHITTGLPFVTLKSAMSIDGKTATKNLESFWITGEAARKHAHYLRSINDAIIVGINTVLKDDPQLTVRHVAKNSFRQPYKIILDSKARIPLAAKVLKDPSNTVVVVSKEAPKKRIDRLKAIGATVIIEKTSNGKISLPLLLKKLGKMKLSSILIEGGGSVGASAIESKIVDKVVFFIAPKIIGGKLSPSPVGGKGIDLLKQAINLKDLNIKRFGKDIMLEGYIEKP